MYKTAIAHVEGNLSYDEALKQFAISYPEYEIRGIKQASSGWMAFIQKGALHNEDLENVLDESDETEMFSPGADNPEAVEEEEEGPEEPSVEEYGEEEEKQEGLLDELQSALEKVEQLVSDIKSSEEEEDEVRPFPIEEEEAPEDGFEMEMPLELEREKEAGVTLASAAQEVEELVKSDSQFKGYKIASFKEESKRFIATLVKE